MRRTGATWNFARRFVTHRRNHVLAVALIAAALGVVVTSTETVGASADRAIEDSLRADLGGRAFALQTTDEDVIRLLQDRTDTGGVLDDHGDLTTSEAATSVMVRTVTDSQLALGVLSEGQRPTEVGDLLVSRATAQALALSVGDPVSLVIGGARSNGRVSGVLVDPADSTIRTVVQLSDAAAAPTATRWLANTDFYSDPELRPYLDSRVATYQSADALVDAARAQRPPFLSGLAFVSAGGGLLLGVVLLTVLGVLSRVWGRDVDALMAAGMSRGTALRHLALTVTAVVAVGAAVGVALAATTLALGRTPVSRWFGQDWTSIELPFPAVAWLAASIVLGGLVAPPFLRLVERARVWGAGRTSRPPGGSLDRLAGVLGIVAVLTIVCITQVPSLASQDALLLLVPGAAVVLAACLPFLVGRLVVLGLPTASATVVRHLGAGVRTIAAAAAVVAVCSGLWAATTTHAANSGEAQSSPYVPPGTFVVSEVPDASVSVLEGAYRDHGGGQLVSYRYLVERDTESLRVTSPMLGRCILDDPDQLLDLVPEDCWPQDTASPVNIIMLGPPGSRPRADPGLMQGDDVALISVSPEGTVSSVTSTTAVPDPQLGGNLPGLVLPPDGDLVHSGRLAPTGTSMVMFPDFHRLLPEDRFELRAQVLRIAPAAQTADGTDPTSYDRQRSLANVLGLLGAAATSLIVLLGGAALVTAHTVTRRNLHDLATRRHGVRTLGVRWIAIAGLTLAATVPLCYLAASYGGRATDYSYGWLWALPGGSSLLACVVVARSFLTVPPLGAE